MYRNFIYKKQHTVHTKKPKVIISFAILMLLGLFSAIFLQFCSTPTETDYEKYEVQGDVRIITFFNTDGQQNAEVAFSREGKLVYDKQGQVLLEYEYNNKHQLTTMRVFYNQDQLETVRTYVYERNRNTEIKHFTANGTYDGVIKYSYDTRGNLLQGEYKSPYNELRYVWKYEYNNNNHKIREIHESFLTNYYRRKEFEVDKYGNVVSMEEFDEYENLIRTRFFEVFHGIALQTKFYEYWSGEISDSTLFSYEFDVRGNWVRRETTPSTGRHTHQTRRILYY